MDSKAYQRAVTPTLDAGSVRGKHLNYSNPSASRAALGRLSASALGAVRPSTTNSPRTGSGNNSSGFGDMAITGRMTGSSVSSKVSAPALSALSALSAAPTHTHMLSEQLHAITLPRPDLVPVHDELPADGIIFARVRGQAEGLVVFRTPEERLRNPERLNLDRRHLEACPLLEQEQRLRLLNYQNNRIKQISNLENLPNLIFLDLYNNQIASLEGPLGEVRGLRVLMAGKNHIARICNLQQLRKLDVLDLHSNEIQAIEGLEGLQELRVLNLAGNKISSVANLNSLSSLTELNLRRNHIERVSGLDKLPALQRIFLSHNAIQSLEDISCVFSVQLLIELSLDGNPISDKDSARYRSKMIAALPGLKHLDLKRISDEERAQSLSSSAAEPGQESTNNTTAEERNAHPSAKQERAAYASFDTRESKQDIADEADPVLTAKPLKATPSVHESSFASTSLQLPSSNSNDEGLTALARAGRLSKQPPIFDIEVVNADERVMVLVGETWEWNAPKRLLVAVTEICALHMRRESLIAKLNSTHLVSLTSLKTLRLMFNEFTSLKQLEFIPAIYGSTLQHLYIEENPVNMTASSMLRAFMIATIPRLQSFNGLSISTAERQQAERAFHPFNAVKNKSIKLFIAASAKLFKANEPPSPAKESSSKNAKGSVSATGQHHFLLLNELNQRQSKRVSYEAFAESFEQIVKGLIKQVVCEKREA